jgi:ATP-binding cassette subfamily F protein uup
MLPLLPICKVLEEYLDEFTGVVVIVSHDRWFCDRVLAPPDFDEDDDPDATPLVRTSSMFVFEGDGAVSQYQGQYSDYFTALKTGGAMAGVIEGITGFPSPPPLPTAPKPAPSPPAPKAKEAAASSAGVASVNIADMANIGLRAPPPPPPPAPKKEAPKDAGPSQRQMAKKIASQSEKKAKKVKVSKKDRKEYETIEEEVETLEVKAAEAEAALAEANAAARRLSTNEMMALAAAASDARRAADQKMERYIELEELISAADAA